MFKTIQAIRKLFQNPPPRPALTIPRSVNHEVEIALVRALTIT